MLLDRNTRTRHVRSAQFLIKARSEDDNHERCGSSPIGVFRFHIGSVKGMIAIRTRPDLPFRNPPAGRGDLRERGWHHCGSGLFSRPSLANSGTRWKQLAAGATSPFAYCLVSGAFSLFQATSSILAHEVVNSVEK